MSTIQAVTYDAALAVTTSDTVADPQGPFAGLMVAVTGNVKFTDYQGNSVTMTAVPVGTFIYVAATRVWATGTTATVYGLRAIPYKKPVSS